jgi:hypothetical protein
VEQRIEDYKKANPGIFSWEIRDRLIKVRSWSPWHELEFWLCVQTRDKSLNGFIGNGSQNERL